MRGLLTILILSCIVEVCAAADPGNTAPVKLPGIYPANLPDPTLQGGDTIAITLQHRD